MTRTLLYSVFFILLFSEISHAQYSVSGTVSLESDGQPVPGAQVFINGTTIGVSTNGDGSFELTNIPTANVELIVRSLGYENFALSLNLNELTNPLEILLKEEVYEMDEITITPDAEEWAYNFSKFREVVIGEGPFSEDTRILNEEVLGFHYEANADRNALEAFAREPLVIENKELGYRIQFYLQDFLLDYRNKLQFFAGQTFFEPMTSRRNRTINKWKENRELAYHGSFVHFTRSVIQGDPAEEGFEVKYEKRENGTRYVASDPLPRDFYFSVSEDSLPEYRFHFDHLLNVSYLNEYEDESYLLHIRRTFDPNPRTLVDFQRSVVIPRADTIRVDASGLVLNPNKLLFEGYWGFEKLSDMLPGDYR